MGACRTEFLRDFKGGDPVLFPRLVGFLFVFVCFPLALFVARFAPVFVAFLWVSLFGGFLGFFCGGFETRLDLSCHWMT